jgi:CPA2 family monovalent cation:H+ antiporter-2
MGIAADFVLIVVAGLAGAIVARLLRLPLLVGYIAAGVLVGPHTGGPTVAQIRDIELLAEIGVALLLFSLGLEISLRDLQPVRKAALAAGAIEIMLCCAAGAWAGARWLGMSWSEGVWFGTMVSLSSTMVVIKTLAARGVTNTLASRLMIGILVVQDLAVIPLLVILPQLNHPDNVLSQLARSAGLAAAILIATVVLGTHILPPVLKTLLRWGSREVFLVAVVAVGVGTGYLMHIVGISFALGAFVAGIILSESEFSHQALSDVVPLRDIFGLLFFVTVGMLFDPSYLWSNPGRIMAAVSLILVGKAVVLGGLSRAFGYVHFAPWIVGLGLAQVGEFSFVLARSGAGSGDISKPTYDLVLTCAVLTMTVSPIVSAAAIPIGRLWRRWSRQDQPVTSIEIPKESLDAHVILGGYGRSGRAVARILRDAEIPLVVVETNYSLYADLKSEGLAGIWGDVASVEILDAAGVRRARLFLLTMPEATTVQISAQRARQANPGIEVIARAAREHHVVELKRAGVQCAVLPEFEGGLEMARQALARYPYEEGKTRALVENLRRELYGKAGAGTGA